MTSSWLVPLGSSSSFPSPRDAAHLTMALSTASTTAATTTAVRVSPQGGILEGGNPSHYDSKNPIVLFIIQVRLP